MTQEEILEVLKKKRRWMTTQEISDILKLGYDSVSVSLRRLKKHNEVQFKKSKKTDKMDSWGGKPYLYRTK